MDNKHNLGFSIIKFMLGAVCYSLVCYYSTLNNLVAAATNSTRLYYLANQIMVTACVAFTFVIEPAIIAASIYTPKPYFKTVLGPLFSFAGFVCYLTSGSLILSNTYGFMFNSDAYFAAGSLFVINAAVYLAHCIYAGHPRVK